MTISESRQAYEDCYEAMIAALEAKDGIRIGFQDLGEATFYRMRMNKARQLDRRFNKERYSQDHPMHSQSEFDALMFRIRHIGGMHWVYAERKAQRGVIEEIGKEEPPVPKQANNYRRS